jgi:tetratricopeptide (TPR) repeat protein
MTTPTPDPDGAPAGHPPAGRRASTRAEEKTMRRAIIAGTAIAATAAGLIVLGGILGPAARPAAPPPSTVIHPVAALTQLDQAITRDQAQLRRVPGDWPTWAALSLAYLEKARITADPTYYPKADAAVARSLTVAPANPTAFVAQGALANARHDFATARRLADRAIAADVYDADAYAVLADALTQLGDQKGATAAIQHLLDLRPGLSAYARASYDLELHGLTGPATNLMSRALADAVDPADISFCRAQLGDLALAGGDLTAARGQYEAGLAVDPESVALRHGLARVDAAQGRLDQALAGYAALTRQAPTPTYLLEYADLLQASGADARPQLALAAAAQRLFVASGGIDGLTGAALAEAEGDPAAALAQARMEFQRRQHPDVIDAYAWALHLSHQDSAALVQERRALAIGARPALYLYHLGMIELSLGQPSAARRDLTAALRTNPAFSALGAADARRALTRLAP